jgi:hypothetical protein
MATDTTARHFLSLLWLQQLWPSTRPSTADSCTERSQPLAKEIAQRLSTASVPFSWLSVEALQPPRSVKAEEIVALFQQILPLPADQVAGLLHGRLEPAVECVSRCFYKCILFLSSFDVI